MKKLQKWGLSLMFATVAVSPVLAPTFAHAESGSNVSTVGQVGNEAKANVLNSGSSSNEDMKNIDGSGYIPDTTMDDANQWVNRKGDDLVGFGGNLAEPISIIGFMLGLFLTLAGALTRGTYLGKGLLIMAISIVVYVGAVFAPELVHYFSSWLAN